MTAVRLRGKDYTDRAIEVHQRHKHGELIKDIAADYNAHPDVVSIWIKHGRKHDHPPLEDRQAWLQWLTGELAARIPDATDADSTRLAKQVGEWLGLSHQDRQRDAMLMMEAERLSMLRDMAARLGVDSDPAVLKVLEAG